jgi:L,D-transpeptidase catalytic domain
MQACLSAIGYRLCAKRYTIGETGNIIETSDADTISWFMKAIFLVAALFVFGADVASAQYSVEIDLGDQKAYLLYDGRAVMESPISTGRYGHLTPGGSYKISAKDLNHTSSIYGKIIDRSGRTVVADADVDMTIPAGTRFVNAPMHYFMEFAPGIGMHAGYLPGYPASHGCVRMPEAKAIAFFRAVSLGTPVNVFGTTPRGRIYQASNPYGPAQEGVEPNWRPRRSFWSFLGF